MAWYRVYGTIELNWCNTVQANSEEDAATLARSLADDGEGHNDPIDRALVDQVNDVTLEIEKAE